MDPNLMNLLVSTTSGVIANKISEYLHINPNPTKEGIVDILSKNYGSMISMEKVSIEADRIINIITQNGGKISMGEGLYKSGGVLIEIANGAKIEVQGETRIEMN